MDDFTKIEVDKIFPGPVHDQEGVQIELWHDKLTVLIQMPELDRDQLIAFNKGFEQYSYLESDTPIPVALWIFDFPDPLSSIEGNFNAKLARRKWLDLYPDAGNDDTIKKVTQFFLLDGQILRAMKLIELDPEAVELFHGTIRLHPASTFFISIFASFHQAHSPGALKKLRRVYFQPATVAHILNKRYAPSFSIY